MIPSDKAYEIIKHHEGCLLKSYKDVAGIWTIGWGTIQYENGSQVQAGQVITQEVADRLLKFEVDKKAASVTQIVRTVQLKQCQFDSLVSFTYNVGIGSLRSSTLLKKLLVNANNTSIAGEFLKWCKAKKPGTKILQTVPGLLARRKSESWLYFNNELKYYHE